LSRDKSDLISTSTIPLYISAIKCSDNYYSNYRVRVSTNPVTRLCSPPESFNFQLQLAAPLLPLSPPPLSTPQPPRGRLPSVYFPTKCYIARRLTPSIRYNACRYPPHHRRTCPFSLQPSCPDRAGRTTSTASKSLTNVFFDLKDAPPQPGP
jgi:hypothetical protein